MDNNYIYAGTLAKVLEKKLLSENQKELLVGAKSVPEMFKVLHNTYIAPFLSKEDPDSIIDALDKSIVQAKDALKKMSPKPKSLEILWIKYDFYNLKTIVKGKRASLSTEDIIDLCYNCGIYTPQEMLKSFERKTLSFLHNNFEKASAEAMETAEIFNIDRIMSRYYFESICDISKNSKDPFVKEFVTLLIDLYNVKAALRVPLIPGLEEKHVFIEGGTFKQEDLDTREGSLKQLRKRFGGKGHWSKILEDFNGESYVALEKELDQHEMNFLKEKSLIPFSSASLFSYFKAQKNNAQIIGTILTAKRASMKEKDLRTILRSSYIA
ncbi:MAG: V-type ATPase subunit [Candidatus Pacebacteria bacterium]|nr:V-type ATPase subunit [Candidatus Paceibacterota bacterium]